MLKILIKTQMSAVNQLDEACFTQDNSNEDNKTINAYTPRGVLGGSVAALHSTKSYTVVAGNLTNRAVGLFVNDAAGAAFENSPAVASNKLTVIKGLASVEVDVYETRNVADSADLVYAMGDKLYCSAKGLLTKEVSTSEQVIGVVTKLPTTASPTIGLDMSI